MCHMPGDSTLQQFRCEKLTLHGGIILPNILAYFLLMYELLLLETYFVRCIQMERALYNFDTWPSCITDSSGGIFQQQPVCVMCGEEEPTGCHSMI
jgi:hypothetical protein